jgi:hypothetical protein
MSGRDRIDDILLSWNLLLPQVASPSELWLGKISECTDSAIQRGLDRAATKFGTRPVDVSQVEKYVLGVARHESRDQEWNTREEDPASRW